MELLGGAPSPGVDPHLGGAGPRRMPPRGPGRNPERRTEGPPLGGEDPPGILQGSPEGSGTLPWSGPGREWNTPGRCHDGDRHDPQELQRLRRCRSPGGLHQGWSVPADGPLPPGRGSSGLEGPPPRRGATRRSPSPPGGAQLRLAPEAECLPGWVQPILRGGASLEVVSW